MSLRSVSIFIFVGAILGPGTSLRAGVTEYFSQPQWLAAVGGTSGLTVFSFQGPTETTGKYADDPTIQPSYASQGVVFLPFTGTTNYPIIARGQQYQISAPNHDGLMVNSSSPNPTTDLEGRAIWFDFNIPARAVGLNFNGPIEGGDYGYLEAFDYSGNLVGQTGVCVAGGFVGLVADTEIYQIHIVNTGNFDITFGIWDLQFKESPVNLKIRPGKPGAVISWPATAQTYGLKSADQLSGPTWQTVTNVPAIVGNDFTVSVAASPNQRFYRLQKQ
jgi:hypothetical protein